MFSDLKTMELYNPYSPIQEIDSQVHWTWGNKVLRKGRRRRRRRLNSWLFSRHLPRARQGGFEPLAAAAQRRLKASPHIAACIHILELYACPLDFKDIITAVSIPRDLLLSVLHSMPQLDKIQLRLQATACKSQSLLEIRHTNLHPSSSHEIIKCPGYVRNLDDLYLSPSSCLPFGELLPLRSLRIPRLTEQLSCRRSSGSHPQHTP